MMRILSEVAIARKVQKVMTGGENDETAREKGGKTAAGLAARAVRMIPETGPEESIRARGWEWMWRGTRVTLQNMVLNQ